MKKICAVTLLSALLLCACNTAPQNSNFTLPSSSNSTSSTSASNEGSSSSSSSSSEVPSSSSEASSTPSQSSVSGSPSSSTDETKPLPTVTPPLTDKEYAATSDASVVIPAPTSLKGDLQQMYTWNPTDYTYHKMPFTQEEHTNYNTPMDKLYKRLQGLKINKDAPQISNPPQVYGLLLVMNDFQKYNLYVNENELYCTELGGLESTPELRKELIDLVTATNKEPAQAQWLVYMNPNRITNVSFSGKDCELKEKINFSVPDTDRIIPMMSNTFREIVVKAGETEVSPAKAIPADSPELMRISFSFNTGVTYHVYITEDSLVVMSSDMDYSLTYQLASKAEADHVRERAINCLNLINDKNSGVRENPPTGKPVIYLYPEAKIDVNVKLDYPKDKLTYTYPAYNSGWNVTAYPDGRLTDKTGNEYYYLFWEGDKVIDWDFSKGFVVKAEDTETFLQEKLKFLGLNARERNDFITYWAPEMRHNPYNLITFSKEQYEDLAPLAVTPAPDTMLRVHMVYKACDASTKVEPQVLETVKREGFTVVEWGGTRG